MLNCAPGWRNLCVLVAFSLASVQVVAREQRGVIGAPAEAGELRAEKDASAPVVATVKPGEPFSFEPEEENEWGKVTAASGKSGWLPLSRIRLFFDASDLPKKDPAGLSEIDEAARRLGFDYVKMTRLAAQGDVKALRQFFTLAQEADGAAAESLTRTPTVVYHLLGDAKFAKYLGAQPVSYQTLVRYIVVRDGRLPPTTLYLQRHFPETTKILFPSEMVAWPSPDGRFAIRKVFSDPFDMWHGKITRAELIEKKTGQVLLDMTADDIGGGADREGKIVWSPDSMRFASLSIRMNEKQANLFSKPQPEPHRKQTVVYQVTGDSWSRVEMTFDKVPGRENDTELEGAMLGHDFIEPVRWQKRNVLLLERHEYYEKMKPTVVDKMKFESIGTLARWHWITATISPEGEVTLVWKLRKRP
jgi:hypothetical protein